jgi:hypothetical protein
MAIYTILPNGEGLGFNISVAGSNGARQTMLGFISMADAEAWITQDKRLNDAADPFLATGAPLPQSPTEAAP